MSLKMADELMKTGLREDSEPNVRGHQIEALIDRLGRLLNLWRPRPQGFCLSTK